MVTTSSVGLPNIQSATPGQTPDYSVANSRRGSSQTIAGFAPQERRYYYIFSKWAKISSLERHSSHIYLILHNHVTFIYTYIALKQYFFSVNIDFFTFLYILYSNSAGSSFYLTFTFTQKRRRRKKAKSTQKNP